MLPLLRGGHTRVQNMPPVSIMEERGPFDRLMFMTRTRLDLFWVPLLV